MMVRRLAEIVADNDESVYVVWSYYDTSDLYMLVELDRPNEEPLFLKPSEFRILEPLEIIERVMEWQ